MKKQILFLIFSIIAIESISSQPSKNIIGEWKIFEMTTDWFYNNYETDSLFIFSIEDQEKFKNPEVRKNFTYVISMFSKNSIIIESDSVLILNFAGMPAEKENFIYDSEQSLLYIGTSSNSKPLKLTKNEILEFDLSD